MSTIKWADAPPTGEWNKLKSLRNEQGLSQIQVAVRAGISLTTLWMLESGFDERVSEEIKRKLAIFFKCDINDIFPCVMIGNKPRAEYLRGLQKD